MGFFKFEFSFEIRVLISVNIAHPISYTLGLIYTFIDGTYTLIYTSYCSHLSLFRLGRTLLLQASPNQMSRSDLIYVLFRNLPHFTLISFVFVKFLYLLIQHFRCHCCHQSPNHKKNEKIHQVSLVSSTLSIDLLTPDYQTKPEFYYIQGKILRIDFKTSDILRRKQTVLFSVRSGEQVCPSGNENTEVCITYR